MAVFLETIITKADGTQIANVSKYEKEITGTIFFHSSLNTNLRLVDTGDLKAYYANLHNDSGVKIKEERWTAEIPAAEGAAQ